MISKNKLLIGEILDETSELTLQEMCYCCSAKREVILGLVEEGVLIPINQDQAAYRFSGLVVRRAIKAVRLHRDLGLNFPGVALALDLIDEIERLREQIEVTQR
jgi:chaperone modulatory protein CbpM